MESLIEISESVDSRQATVTGMGGSLLALSRAQARPTEDGLSQVLEDLALGLERNVRVREEMAERAREHNLRMAEMYRAIIELLELLRQRMEEEQSMRAGLEPLASSMTSAFAEMNARIEAQEERQHETLENTLRQWVAERQSAESERILEMERLQVQARMEANRMLRMMWLGAGLAAVGAGVAMFLVNN